MAICKTCGLVFEPKRTSRSESYCSGACYYARGPDGPRKVSVKRPRQATAKGHPLAPASGIVANSRLILYDKLGAGPHRCHWCGREVIWRTGTKARASDALIADHLDWDPLNDDPANLVPSCNSCNVRRAAPGKRGAIQSDEPMIVLSTGARTRAVERWCDVCGKSFLSVPSKPGRFCSRECRIERMRLTLPDP